MSHRYVEVPRRFLRPPILLLGIYMLCLGLFCFCGSFPSPGSSLDTRGHAFHAFPVEPLLVQPLSTGLIPSFDEPTFRRVRAGDALGWRTGRPGPDPKWGGGRETPSTDPKTVARNNGFCSSLPAAGECLFSRHVSIPSPPLVIPRGGPSLGQPKNFRCGSLCCCVGDCVVGHCHLYPLHSWQDILLTFAEMELDSTTMFPPGTSVMFYTEPVKE